MRPRVYNEKESSDVKSIAGVGTTTGAFVGLAEKGPIGQAVYIANWEQFVKIFGDFNSNFYLAYAVYQFFREGGTGCYVVRTCHYENITDAHTRTAKFSTEILKDEYDTNSMLVSALSEGKWGDRISVRIETDPGGKKFNLIVMLEKKEVESYVGLTKDHINENINLKSAYIKVEEHSWWSESQFLSSGSPPTIQTIDLKNGNDGVDTEQDGYKISTLTTSDFVGDEKAQNGLHAYDTVEDINIVAIPDRAGERETMISGLYYCKNRQDCFFIADPPIAIMPREVLNFKNGTGYYTGNAFDTSFGSLYYPWVVIKNPLNGSEYRLMPPSGAVAGVISHVDSTRGINRAPAGTYDGHLDSAVDVERIVAKGEHDFLDPTGINVIRKLPTSEICIWGARTLANVPEWKYINIRRLCIYLEGSIRRATQWAEFEHNSPSLWSSVIRNVRSSLLETWRNGLLFGSSPEEAFYIKVDDEINTEKDRCEGKLNIEVGVAPVRPAEFIIIKISRKTLAR